MADYKNYTAEGPGFTILNKRIGLPWLRFDLIGASLSSPENRLKDLQIYADRVMPLYQSARR